MKSPKGLFALFSTPSMKEVIDMAKRHKDRDLKKYEELKFISDLTAIQKKQILEAEGDQKKIDQANEDYDWMMSYKYGFYK